MGKIITFGEIMLRLQTERYLRFSQATKYDAVYGGGEANVAVSLANYGADVAFVTKLPKHEIGQGAVNALRSYGVDTGLIVRGGKRTGIYFIEKGASQRSSKVIYDRAGSAIAEASSDDFDWERIFDGAEWFHFTGITPALGENVAQICLEACKAAKSRNITVSCDLNYRKNLWTTAQAEKTMSELMEYVDVCIANEEDSEKVFGIKAKDSDVYGGVLSESGYRQVAEELRTRFGFRLVAITLRTSISASDNRWSALLWDGNTMYTSKTYDVHIVDRVGGGDSFGAGLIYGLTQKLGLQKTLDFAVAASCLKHSIEGDFNLVTADEVMTLANGDGSGRVQR